MKQTPLSFFNEAENVTCFIPKNFFTATWKRLCYTFDKGMCESGNEWEVQRENIFTWNSMQVLLSHRHNLTSDYRAHEWLQYNGDPRMSWVCLFGFFFLVQTRLLEDTRYLFKRRCCNWVRCHQNWSIMWKKLSRSSFISERQQAQIMAESGDTKEFGSWHKLAANKSFLCNFQLCVPP